MNVLYAIDLPNLEQVMEDAPVTVTSDILLIDVIDLMNRTLGIDSSLGAGNLPQQRYIGCILIVEGKRLIGIFTLKDVVRVIASGQDLSGVRIGEVMTQQVITLTPTPEDTALTALLFMGHHQISHLPVLDAQGELVGLVTQERIRQVIEPAHCLKFRTVADVMVTQVVHAPPTASLRELAQTMSDRQISCVVIVTQQPGDRHLFPVGMVTERDMINFQLQGLDIDRTPAEAVMSQPVCSVSASDLLWRVQELMQQQGVRRVVVVGEHGELQGLVTQTNLLQIFNPSEMLGVMDTLQQKVHEQTMQLQTANQQLQQEVSQRQQVEASLKQAQAELELRVAERTAELVQKNVRLHREIAERKQIEIALQERSHQWQALFDHALDAIAIVDDEGKYVDANPAACKLFGVSKPELLSARITDFTTPGFDFAQTWQQFCQQGRMLGEFKLRRPDGTVRDTEFAAVANFIPHRHLSIIRDVSDRQQAETRLQKSEQRLQLALLASNTGIWDWNLQTNEVHWSQDLFYLFGVTPDTFEVSYENFLNSIVHPEDRQHLHQSVLHSIDQQVPYDIEFRFIYPDGKVGWSVCKGKVLCDDTTGEPLQMIGVNIDITERKQAELALRESEKRLQLALSATNTGIWDWNLQTNEVIWSENVFPLFDLDSQIFNCNLPSFLNCIHPEDREFVEQSMMRAIDEQTLCDVEFRIVWRDGTIHWGNGKGKAFYDQTGQPLRMIGVHQDITNRKQTEASLRESEQRLQAIIDNSPAVIYVKDIQGKHLLVNSEFERITHLKREEVKTKTNDEIFASELAQALTRNDQDILTSGKPLQSEEVIELDDGLHTYLSIKFPLCDSEGRPYAICGISTDITEKKQLEQQFYRAQRLESIGTLASGIAHDLNNVFAPIVMIAQLLPLRCKNVDVRTQELFKTLETSSKRGSDLVKQILTFARGKEGQRILLQPGHLLKELVKVIKQTFPKGIEIHTDIPSNTLWMLQADPTQLDQVFMNLAVNARDAMPNGGMLTITAENYVIDETYARMHLEARAGGYVLVKVADTGTGIPPEFLERIFDPFFTTKEVGKGTGLGLSTVLGIVKNHGGFVEVSSQVGRGTQFRVFLPISTGTATEVNIETELPRGHGELILVADDETVVQQTTQETLEDYNYRTLVVNDGIEAIALYAQQPNDISVVLLDMLMPNMDGLTTIRTLKALNPQVKIIATSGLPANEQKAIAVGATKFLSKPYTATELLQTLADVVQN
ncbi:histidine kinase [Nostoc sp. CENA543]|uniref:PAS domain S-box protein n=1 Tax=Nostoc sp. CENA543 TaxID=1869241 RepID=UPI000CA149AF|nr:PAS domain S-box protein [Nostoc sp. CENA543]AUT01084.1 histidine kinase [Nostoc sp. CENA543]